MGKMKLGVTLNPDVAKIILGWDREKEFHSNEPTGIYGSKSTDDVGFFWDTQCGTEPQVVFYVKNAEVQEKEQ